MTQSLDNVLDCKFFEQRMRFLVPCKGTVCSPLLFSNLGALLVGGTELNGEKSFCVTTPQLIRSNSGLGTQNFCRPVFDDVASTVCVWSSRWSISTSVRPGPDPASRYRLLLGFGNLTVVTGTFVHADLSST